MNREGLSSPFGKNAKDGMASVTRGWDVRTGSWGSSLRGRGALSLLPYGAKSRSLALGTGTADRTQKMMSPQVPGLGCHNSVSTWGCPFLS